MSILDKALKAAAGNAGVADAPNIEDVFSTYLYEGASSTVTINNGIDLAGEGGLVWIKNRDNAKEHVLYDTNRGIQKKLVSNTTNSEDTHGLDKGVNSFNSNGFAVGDGDSEANANGWGSYASWTFRKRERFFDVVTYTGDGVTGREIAHDLGCDVGMIFIKLRHELSGNTGSWRTYHKSLGGTQYLLLEDTVAANTWSGIFNDTDATDSVFTVTGHTHVNALGGEYVAYLFAHDPDGEDDDGMIACGSYTGNAGVQSINIGWEPQYVLIKRTDQASGWAIYDSMRTMVVSDDSGGDEGHPLYAHTSNSEDTTFSIKPQATGFAPPNAGSSLLNENNGTYIYMAIRAPMMVEPEAGSEVFLSHVATPASGVTIITTSFPVDATLFAQRSKAALDDTFMFDRIRGESKRLVTNKTDTEGTTSSDVEFDHSDQLVNRFLNMTTSGVHHMFKRAKGFFDVVATKSLNSSVNHSLGVTPEFVIYKRRDALGDWTVCTTHNGFAYLNTTGAFVGLGNGPGVGPNLANATETTIHGGYVLVGSTSADMIIYLFATLDGVSKVGSYTGNGTSQTIDCGFSAGARFVLIKRTDSTGDWFIWDTERGIVAGNDPHLSLNTIAAEVTSDDSIDPHSTGFIVHHTEPWQNSTSGTYIFLAIA